MTVQEVSRTRTWQALSDYLQERVARERIVPLFAQHGFAPLDPLPRTRREIVSALRAETSARGGVDGEGFLAVYGEVLAELERLCDRRGFHAARGSRQWFARLLGALRSEGYDYLDGRINPRAEVRQIQPHTSKREQLEQEHVERRETGERGKAINGSSEDVGHRKVRILFLAANPRSTQRRLIEREVRKIDQRLREARYRDHFELISRWAVRSDDLAQALLEVEPDILHFSGHGNRNDEILLEDERGRAFPVGKEALAELVRVLKDRIRLVVLNACYSLVQARAIVEHIGCAVGMQRAFGAEAAIEFAAGLYQGLAFGRSVGQAFDIGKAMIKLKAIPEDRAPQILAAGGVDPHNLFIPATSCQLHH